MERVAQRRHPHNFHRFARDCRHRQFPKPSLPFTTMPRTYAANFIHCVFSTKGRRDAIPPEFQERLWAYLRGIAKNLGIELEVRDIARQKILARIISLLFRDKLVVRTPSVSFAGEAISSLVSASYAKRVPGNYRVSN